MSHFSKGYLLPMVVIFVVISVIIGLSILYLGGLERIATIRRLYREQAFYLAEAGAQRAFAYLKASQSVPDVGSDVSLGPGTFRVQLSSDAQGDTVVTSIGTVNGIQEAVELTFGVTGPRNSWAQGIFGRQSITLGENARINGNIGSTGTITMDNNSTVQGSATVTGGPGTISMGKGAVVSGGTNYNSTFDDPLQNLTNYPVLIPASLSSLAYPVQGDSRISGDYTLSSGVLTLDNNKTANISGGDFRFSRIVLGNNARLIVTGNARFYVENQWTLSNNSIICWTNTVRNAVIYIGSGCTTSLDNNSLIDNQTWSAAGLRIYSASSNPLTFSNNTQTLSALVYAPSATVNLSNNAIFNGGIIANNVAVSNNAVITYNVSNESVDDDPGGPFTLRLTILRWRKPNWQGQLQ